MPLIRCPKCGQAYDVPGVIAVRLPNSIATCHCGEWLSGSKAAVLARLLNPDQIKEVDLAPYRVDDEAAAAPAAERAVSNPEAPTRARSVRVIARGAHESFNTVFTIQHHPLWIGRKGCHVELAEAELSLKHCSIFVRGDQLVVKDLDSHMGSYLDGQKIEEAIVGDGVHVLRVGSALVTIEPTNETGVPVVEPISFADPERVEEAQIAGTLEARAQQSENVAKRAVLICIAGALNGQEFEIPAGGLVVGREGHVRVPDEFLSRKHFEVLRDEEGNVRVRDLGSRNGTFLNTMPARNTKVHPGDEITAGVNRFRIEHR
ncbi:MAG TPA: FHA domain-containing protein [Thermoanaerobaculia bacterium]|nr:FHA domain-containing protein [Thermoanaerobaculia bacterium]